MSAATDHSDAIARAKQREAEVKERNAALEIPEPPDGARIEFEYYTDVYAAWRSDKSSAEVGWTSGDGGEVWCLYGDSVPHTWVWMLEQFGDSLRCASRLVQVPAAPESQPVLFAAAGGDLSGRQWEWERRDERLTIDVNPDGEVTICGELRYPDNATMRQIAAVLLKVSTE